MKRCYCGSSLLVVSLLALTVVLQQARSFTLPNTAVRLQRCRSPCADPSAPWTTSARSTTSLSVFEPHIVQDALSTLPHLQIATTINEIGERAIGDLGSDIFTFLVALVVIVPLSKTLNITPVLGFLVAGCLMGPYGLELFSNTEADLELGDFGILFLLFTEGLGLSPERIKVMSQFSGLGLLQLSFSMFIFFFGIILAGPFILMYVEMMGIPLDDSLLRPILSSPAEAFCIAAAGALSSSAFVLPVLKAKGWEDRSEGIAGLSILLLQDLAVAPLLVILPLLAGSGPQSGGEFGILVFKATFGFGAVLAVGSYILRYVFDVVAASRSTETFVAAALLVALGMGQVADFLGLSASTGAFAAGVLLAGNRYRAQIQADIKPFEGILLGVFFLTAGASLDPSVVVREWPTLLTGIAAFIVTKAAVLFFSGPLIGKTPAQAARVAITLSGGGEFSFVLFKLAEDLGVLSPALSKLLTASVIISMSLTPLLGELGDFAGNYIESRFDMPASGEIGEISPAEAAALFDEIDADKSDSIELEELRVALLDRGLKIVSVAELFAAFDEDGNGTISRDEWKKGLDAGLLSSALTMSINDFDESGLESDLSFARDAVVICGYGELGKEVCDILKSSGAKKGSVIAFDLNPSKVTAGVLAGAPVVYGDASRIELLRAAGVTNPKAVIITYASDAREIGATVRLRDALPDGTPIYARARNSRVGQELLDAGATEIINETTEAGLRFGSLLGAFDTPTEKKRLRKLSLAATNEWEVVPGFSEEALSDLAEEVGCTRRDIDELYEIFVSTNEGDDVPISEVRDMLMRSAGDGPVDDERLSRCLQRSDVDGGGDLTFEEFVRASYEECKLR